MPQVLAQISQASPELYYLISSNPEAFERALNAEGGQSGGSGGSAPSHPPPGTIQVSPEEAAAIQRLMQFGFTKMDAAQAYFACDKNEEMAANLLFDRQMNGDLDPMEGEDPQQPGGEEDDDEDDNLFN